MRSYACSYACDCIVQQSYEWLPLITRFSWSSRDRSSNIFSARVRCSFRYFMCNSTFLQQSSNSTTTLRGVKAEVRLKIGAFLKTMKLQSEQIVRTCISTVYMQHSFEVMVPSCLVWKKVYVLKKTDLQVQLFWVNVSGQISTWRADSTSERPIPLWFLTWPILVKAICDVVRRVCVCTTRTSWCLRSAWYSRRVLCAARPPCCGRWSTGSRHLQHSAMVQKFHSHPVVLETGCRRPMLNAKLIKCW